MNNWKRIKLKIGDMVVKYDNGKAEQGVLHRKQPPYYDHKMDRQVGTLWEVLGWETRILESFLKKKIHDQWIKHYPAEKK